MIVNHTVIFLQHEVRLRPKYIFSRETTTDKNTKQMPTPHKPSDILGQLQTLDLRFVTQSFVSSDFGSDIQSLTIHMSSCCRQAHKLKCVSLKKTKGHTISSFIKGGITWLEKMAIILPTGQWYAPSAVINDAWYCIVLHGIALYCLVLHGIAWHCMVLRGIAWFYMVLHGVARYCM